ncbi:MAG: RDD family protein, partial [Pseudobdellovibrio sp.]
VYMIMMRVFMGASLGEWSCQLRLGQPVQRIKPTYVLRVVARTTLLLGTGVVVFPILSLILNRDLLGDITGIRIYSLT